MKTKLKEKKSSAKSTKEKLGVIKKHKNLEKKKSKLALKEKRIHKKRTDVDSSNGGQLPRKDEQTTDSEHKILEKKKSRLTSKKQRRREKKENEVDFGNDGQGSHDDGQTLGEMNPDSTSESDSAKKSAQKIGSLVEPKEVNARAKNKTKKVKASAKHKKKGDQGAKEQKIEETVSEVDVEKVDEISSVDEDCSRGMKKWLMRYKESRPGLQILQQRIDEFTSALEEKQEQERKEREVKAAEGGWTVVVHHKGRKKTTDAESGITVGSVAQAAVVDKMAKKKSKEVALDFYRFQRREARRNELMLLQSKFEQDKKRIQELRAARKFRPY